MITVGGVSVFATPITEEKEEATLGLLRMAGINPLGLLLGKSSTRLFAAALILAIQIPFTLLAITLGGVLWPQIFAAYQALAAYLFLVAQLGLLCSVICARSASASGLSGVVIGVFLIFPTFAGMALRQWGTLNPGAAFIVAPLETVCDWLVRAAIWSELREVLMSTYQPDLISFQVWTNLAAAAVLFTTACLTFDWFTRDHLTSVPSRGGLFRFRTRGSRLRSAWLSPGRSWNLAVLWKEFHFTTGGFPQLVTRFVAYGVLIFGLALFALYLEAREHPVVIFGRAAWLTMLFIGGIEMAIYCSRLFREELRWQTYSALMMLPGSLPRMAWLKVGGVALAWCPALLWLAIGILLDGYEFGHGVHELFEDLPFLGIFFVLHYLFFLHLVAWLSLVMKWGSLPLSFVIAYPMFWTLTIGCIDSTRMSEKAGNVMFGFFDFCMIFILAAIQMGIWQQLRTHAESA
jgi:hypothetical protein